MKDKKKSKQNKIDKNFKREMSSKKWRKNKVARKESEEVRLKGREAKLTKAKINRENVKKEKGKNEKK